MEIFEFGITGFPICVEGNALCATTEPSGQINIFKQGSTGRKIHVDDAGRLLIALKGIKFKQEDLSSQITGSNTEFIITNVPLNNTVKLYWNGHFLRTGTDHDFVLDNKTIKTNFMAYLGNNLIVNYFFKEA